MEFLGVIESKEDFMCGLPIMCIFIEDSYSGERQVMGMITGDINDAYDHYVAPINRNIDDWIDTEIHIGNKPPVFTFTPCTYAEACKKALSYYPEENTVTMKLNDKDLVWDISHIKQNLKEASESIN